MWLSSEKPSIFKGLRSENIQGKNSGDFYTRELEINKFSLPLDTFFSGLYNTRVEADTSFTLENSKRNMSTCQFNFIQS